MIIHCLRWLALLALLLPGPALADPALWVGHGPRGTVYLLGSVHTLRPGTEWQTPAIRRAFNRSSQCWFEVAGQGNPAAMKAIVARLGVDPDHRLSSLLPPTAAARLKAAEAQSGLPGGPAAIEMMRPWLAAISLFAGRLQQAGFKSELGVDSVLQHDAAAAGKAVFGFETFEKQMQFLAGLPPEFGIKFLTASLDDPQNDPAQVDTLVAHWKAGDVTFVGDLLAGPMRQSAPELFRVLFTERNAAWVPTIQRLLMEDHTALVTVGAAHLAGPGNLIELLGEAGVTFERVSAP